MVEHKYLIHQNKTLLEELTQINALQEGPLVLFAVDELTGLIGAAALMRPSKSVCDMEVSSLKKKFKDKRFAAGCSRDVIKRGAEILEWDINDLFARTIEAMRESEAKIAAAIEEL